MCDAAPVAGFRYAQFCPLARATEILGERWTLLVVRELIDGPRRFSDLRPALAGISSSVLAERLARLEERGLVRRRELPPPAPATVYELTRIGRALEPVILELTRFGVRFLEAPRPGDHVEPHWVRLGMRAFARRGATPARRFNVAVSGSGREVRFGVRGGPGGTAIGDEFEDPDASVAGDTFAVMTLLAGALAPADGIRSGALRAGGNVDALVDLPSLFEMNPNE